MKRLSLLTLAWLCLSSLTSATSFITNLTLKCPSDASTNIEKSIFNLTSGAAASNVENLKACFNGHALPVAYSIVPLVVPETGEEVFVDSVKISEQIADQYKSVIKNQIVEEDADRATATKMGSAYIELMLRGVIASWGDHQYTPETSQVYQSTYLMLKCMKTNVERLESIMLAINFPNPNDQFSQGNVMSSLNQLDGIVNMCIDGAESGSKDQFDYVRYDAKLKWAEYAVLVIFGILALIGIYFLVKKIIRIRKQKKSGAGNEKPAFGTSPPARSEKSPAPITPIYPSTTGDRGSPFTTAMNA